MKFNDRHYEPHQFDLPTGEGRERLLKLADFLDRLPEPNFSLAVIMSRKLGWKRETVPETIIADMERSSKTGFASECNSVACAYGWCPVVMPECLRVEMNGVRSTASIRLPDSDRWESVTFWAHISATSRLFGMEDSAAMLLFNQSSMAQAWSCYNGSLDNFCLSQAMREITCFDSMTTPKAMAVRIRSFVETGKVLVSLPIQKH